MGNETNAVPTEMDRILFEDCLRERTPFSEGQIADLWRVVIEAVSK